jgi:hypothetical protein
MRSLADADSSFFFFLCRYAANTQLPLALPTPPPLPLMHTAEARSLDDSTYYDNTAPEKIGRPRQTSDSSSKATMEAPLTHESAPVSTLPAPRSPTRPVHSSDGFIFTRFQRPQRYIQEADITVMLTKERSNRYLDLYCELCNVFSLWHGDCTDDFVLLYSFRG